ncbi:unknown [Coprobacillus sp. CAG:826]|nr:unknown [Coprobacillus sp. CAG:826]
MIEIISVILELAVAIFKVVELFLLKKKKKDK